MSSIFSKHLIDVKTDTSQDGTWDERLLVENKTIVSLPYISQCNYDNDIGRSQRLLTVSDIVKVEGNNCVTDIIYGNCWPQKFNQRILEKLEGNTLDPNFTPRPFCICYDF